MTDATPQAALLSDDEIERHFENNKSVPGRELRRLIGRSIEAAILAKLQATQEPVQAGELPEPELGYIKTDKSNQPAYSARQMRAALSARKPLAGLTREQMEAGRHQVFSTNNPFCPCDSKTFRKVSEWTEREFCRINGLEVKT